MAPCSSIPAPANPKATAKAKTLILKGIRACECMPCFLPATILRNISTFPQMMSSKWCDAASPVLTYVRE
jgi:hypothetical protein